MKAGLDLASLPFHARTKMAILRRRDTIRFAGKRFEVVGMTLKRIPKQLLASLCAARPQP